MFPFVPRLSHKETVSSRETKTNDEPQLKASHLLVCISLRIPLIPPHPIADASLIIARPLFSLPIPRLLLESKSFAAVDATGAPHALPAAFLWDEAQSTFLISSTAEEDRDRLTQIQQNPKVGLHFNLDMSGADSFILTGEAKVGLDDPSFDQIPAWVAKYQAFFEHQGLTIQQAAVVSPVALRARPLTMIARYGGAMEEQ